MLIPNCMRETGRDAAWAIALASRPVFCIQSKARTLNITCTLCGACYHCIFLKMLLIGQKLHRLFSSGTCKCCFSISRKSVFTNILPSKRVFLVNKNLCYRRITRYSKYTVTIGDVQNPIVNCYYLDYIIEKLTFNVFLKFKF